MTLYKIWKDVFIDAKHRVDLFKDGNGRNPDTVRIGSITATWDEFLVANTVWMNWYNEHGKTFPDYIMVEMVGKPPTPAPQPSSGKSAWHLMVEQHIGGYTTFTEAYNHLIGRGYKYYYNDVYSQGAALDRLAANSGLNCADVSQILYAIATDLGYQVRYVHVQCISGGHVRLQIKGKEFGRANGWATPGTRVDGAAAISTGTRAKIGTVWCPKAPLIDYNPAWLMQGT